MRSFLHHRDVELAAKEVAKTILSKGHETAYAVPRGGIPAAYLVQRFCNVKLVSDPKNADCFIDDLIDSGSTMQRYRRYEVPFYALFDKRDKASSVHGKWVVFPWEHTEEQSGEDIVLRMLQFIGEDVEREGLKETPARVLRAYREWFGGYGKEPKDVVKVFEDGGENYDQMVVVRDIPFYSHCEHHIAPFFGTATIAYIPSKKILGLSKLSRLLDVFARRLQVQERLTTQVLDSLVELIEPVGAGVIIHARHLCMESRGISKQGHETVTSAVSGALKDSARARSEFMGLI